MRRSANTYPTARWGLVSGKGSKKGLQSLAPCLVIVIKLEVSLEWLDVLAGYRCESLQVYVLIVYSLPLLLTEHTGNRSDPLPYNSIYVAVKGGCIL